MKNKYCCSSSKDLYEEYYMNQSGSGMPIFQGTRAQRGHGLGSVLSGFFRSAWPIIKRGLGIFGKHALRTGGDILGDVSEGQPLKEAAKRRVTDRINDFVPGLIPQSGSGRRRRRIKSKKSKAKRRKRDIFS